MTVSFYTIGPQFFSSFWFVTPDLIFPWQKTLFLSSKIFGRKSHIGTRHIFFSKFQIYPTHLDSISIIIKRNTWMTLPFHGVLFQALEASIGSGWEAIFSWSVKNHLPLLSLLVCVCGRRVTKSSFEKI